MNLDGILEALSEVIYIADMESYEMLYLNTAGQKLFGGEAVYKGAKCYELLQGRDAPCEFCTNAYLKRECFHIWPHYNEKVHRYFTLKDKIVNWHGRKAKLQIAFDITDEREKSLAMQKLLDEETLLLDCIMILHRDAPLRERVNQILAIIGDFTNADSVYISRLGGSELSNIYEWRRKSIPPEMKQTQRTDFSLPGRWRDQFFSQDRCVMIEDAENIRLFEKEYEAMHARCVHSLIAVPMKDDLELIGYIGIDNPSKEQFQSSPTLFTTLSIFLASVLLRQENEELMRALSFRDSLTGINNRHKFNQDLISDKYKKNVGVLYIDLNGLKKINDCSGHADGDRALCTIANVLKDVFSEEVIYRLGGDEFAVVCPDIDRTLFSKKITRVKNAVSDAGFDIAVGHTYAAELSGSINVKYLLREADERMYKDKKRFYRGNGGDVRYRHGNDILLELNTPEIVQKKLEENRFSIWLQPIFSAKENRLCKAEALLRYYDDNGTLIMPKHFIPGLEQNALIEMVDLYVLYKVCGYLSSRIEHGLKTVPISVNFSYITLINEHFFEHFEMIWNRYHLPKDLVEFEITEETNPEKMQDIFDIASRMKKDGFSISIDDFGSKYSNVFFFSFIDFNVIKLDMSIVKNIAANPRTYSIIKSIVEICHKSGIKIVAEGVETQGELDALSEINCDYIQGYFFGKPVHHNDFFSRYL